MPYRLSAFADEISPDIQRQMDSLVENGIQFCAMRGANGRNVMQFEDFQISLMKTQFLNRGIRFSCIGSPVGKIPVTDPFAPELARFRRAAALAKGFDTKVVRVFSFIIPKGAKPETHQAEVLRRMKALADEAKALGVNMVIENERDLYGDIADRQAEILEHINSPHVRAAFDFANYILSGDDPLKGWPKLKKHVVDFHIKDCRKSDKAIVAAGKGDGKIKEVLQDAFASKWAGLITFEPHLSKAGPFDGFTGPELFTSAVKDLKSILASIGAN